MQENLEKEYWEKYYSNSKIDKNRIERICSRYDYYWDLLINNGEDKKEKTIIEIGGHPGRYLAYLGDRYNLKPTSLDFNSDTSKIEESMNLFGVKDYEIIQSDLFKHTTDKKYDFVISNGFIEHFEDFHKVMDLHLNYLSPKGTLLIMIPNMRGYIKFYKSLVDKDNLKTHNLKSMSLNVFKSFAKRNNLEILKLNYMGGFPYSLHWNASKIPYYFYRVHKLLFNSKLDKIIEKYPSPYFSSTIIGVFKAR